MDFFGEQFGTEYDVSNACPKCGAGRIQKTPLILDVKKIPKKTDFAITITSTEVVVSQRVVDLIEADNISGCHFRPVVDSRKRKDQPKWYQLEILAICGDAVPPTKFGINFFHEDLRRELVCPEHGLAGLQILSELYIHPDSNVLSDISITRNRIGQFRGWLVPNHMMIISQRFVQLLKKYKIKGYELEVVPFVK